MAIPSFFKQNKPRGFNYKPRYYDPVKEELEQRRKAWEEEKRKSGDRQNNIEPSSAEAAQGTSRQPYHSRIMRGDMKRHLNRRQEKVQKQSTIRLIAIIIILAFVIYLYLRF